MQLVVIVIDIGITLHFIKKYASVCCSHYFNKFIFIAINFITSAAIFSFCNDD